MNKYLQLESSTGRLYEYSKTEKEDFEKHVHVDEKKGTTSTSYRKYYKKGAFGYLKSVEQRPQKVGDRMIDGISLTFEEVNGDILFINFPLKNVKGDIQDYAVSLISYLPHLVKDTPYRFFPYAMEDKPTDGKKPRKTCGVSFAYARLSDNAVDDVDKIKRLSFEVGDRETGGIKTAGDIPKIDYEMQMGKPVAVKKNRNNYLWDILTKHEIKGEFGATKKFSYKDEIANASEPAGEPTPGSGHKDDLPSQPVEKRSALQPNKEFDSIPAATATATSTTATSTAPAAISSDDDDDDDDLPF